MPSESQLVAPEFEYRLILLLIEIHCLEGIESKLVKHNKSIIMLISFNLLGSAQILRGMPTGRDAGESFEKDSCSPHIDLVEVL